MNVIFVRSDDTANMAPAIGSQLRATSPETAGLELHFGAGVAQERIVAGRLPVVPDGIGNVGADIRTDVALCAAVSNEMLAARQTTTPA